MKVIDKIMIDYSTRMQNNREVPDWLLKQVNGVWLAADDFNQGVQLIIDGLQDQGYIIDGLLEAL